MLLDELFSIQSTTLWNVSTWSQATSRRLMMMDQPPLLSPPILPLDPLLSPVEQRWIRSLFLVDNEDEDDNVESDDDENEKDNHKKNRVQWMVTYCEEEEEDRTEKQDDERASSSSSSSSWEYFVKVATSLNPHPQVQFIHLQPPPPQSQAATTTCRKAMEGRPPTLVLQQSSSSFVWIHPYYHHHHPTQPSQGTESQATPKIEDDDRIGGSLQEPLQLVRSSSHEDHTTTTSTPPLHEVLARLLRPTLLWWDRQSTTSIAFAEYYTTHAVLVVEFLHPLATAAVQDFQKACRNYQWEAHQDFSSSSTSLLLNITQPDLVCLVVPSTETRVLKTFGIDIWSNLGVEAEQDEDKGISPLPLVFLTHRTERHGVQRYYYQEDPRSTSSTNISRFFEDFFQGRLHPELSSRWHGGSSAESSSSSDTHNHNTTTAMIMPPLTPNKHGILQWTAFHAEHYGGHDPEDKLSSRGPRLDYTIVGEETHGGGGPAYTLLLAYTPTCGHCKRIHVLWNKLGRLIQSELKWGNWLQIARIDVSRETFQEQGAFSLPSIYLYSHHHHHPQQQHQQQEQSQHDKSRQRVQAMLPTDQKDASPVVGNLNDPIDVLVWFLDMTQEDDEVDEAKLLHDLKQSLSIK